MSSTRKTFLLQMVSGGGLLVLGCGGGGGDSTPAQQPAGGGCSATIAGNHGHELSIPTADLSSMVAMSYDIRGSADHTHSVTFSAAQLAQLKAGTAVTVTSTTTFGHEHSISESCA